MDVEKALSVSQRMHRSLTTRQTIGERSSMTRMFKFAVPVALLLVLLLATSPAAWASSEVRGGCDEATATALGEEYDLNPFANPFAPEPVKMSPLCGEFLEPGIEAMIARAVPATCGGYAGWAAFRHEADGSWQLVWREQGGQWNLEAVGNELKETGRILGPHDALCVGRTATKTRLWHWNGQEFVAGPWTVHPVKRTPRLAIPTTAHNAFFKPSCDLSTRCRARVTIRGGGKVLARGRYSVPANSSRKVAIGLTRAGRKVLARKPRIRAKLTIVDTHTGKRETVPVVLKR